MSVFYVAQWSVAEPDTTACEAVLGKLAGHIRDNHAAIRSVRTYRQAWGPAPRRSYTWLEEFETLAALEGEAETPACAEAWAPVHALALTSSFTGSVWTGLRPDPGFER